MKVKYPCPVPNCGKNFCTPEYLKRHIIRHDPESSDNSIVSCSICNVKLKKLSLSHHIRKHTTEMKYTCPSCDKGFFNTHALKQHQLVHLPLDKRQLFSCNLCNFTTAHSGYLNQHKKIKHSLSPKTYVCTFCDKIFNYISSYKKHLLRHTGEKPYPCTQCEKAFVRVAELHSHVQLVHDEKKYKCSNCPKAFGRESNLNLHQSSVHEGKLKSDPCPTCGKVFKAMKSLKQHLKAHNETREKNYKCSNCSRSYLHKSSLQIHSRTHSGTRPYSCSLCEKTFVMKGSLDHHMLRHLERKFRCEICKRFYPSAYHLRAHIRSAHIPREYKFKCQFCEGKFSKVTQLNQHIRTHLGEKPVNCDQCTTTFYDNSELRKHLSTVHRAKTRNKIRLRTTGESSFKCQHCSEIFFSMRAWGLHVRTHPEFGSTREWGETRKKSTNYKCIHCQKSFCRNIFLVQHLTTHRIETEFNCKPCIVLVHKLN